MVASINWAVIRTRSSALRTLPSNTYRTPNSWLTLAPYRPTLVGECRVAGDDKQAGELREVGDEVFGETVAEILLLRVLTHVDKGQHDDGGLVGQGGEAALAQ